MWCVKYFNMPRLCVCLSACIGCCCGGVAIMWAYTPVMIGVVGRNPMVMGSINFVADFVSALFMHKIKQSLCPNICGADKERPDHGFCLNFLTSNLPMALVEESGQVDTE